MEEERPTSKHGTNNHSIENSQKYYDSEDEANAIISKYEHLVGGNIIFENESWTLKKISIVRQETHFVLKCNLFIPPSKHFVIPIEELRLF